MNQANVNMTENVTAVLFKPLMPGGDGMPYVLEQTCNFQLQVCLSTYDFFHLFIFMYLLYFVQTREYMNRAVHILVPYMQIYHTKIPFFKSKKNPLKDQKEYRQVFAKTILPKTEESQTMSFLEP